MKPEDIIIACAEAMGWTFETRNKPPSAFAEIIVVSKHGVDIGSLWPDRRHEWIKDFTLMGIPNYPADPAAALTLCGALSTEGWLCKITMEGPHNWTCLFYKSRPTKTRACYGKSATLSGAICEAFLRVKGLWDDGASAN